MTVDIWNGSAAPLTRRAVPHVCPRQLVNVIFSFYNVPWRTASVVGQLYGWPALTRRGDGGSGSPKSPADAIPNDQCITFGFDYFYRRHKNGRETHQKKNQLSAMLKNGRLCLKADDPPQFVFFIFCGYTVGLPFFTRSITLSFSWRRLVLIITNIAKTNPKGFNVIGKTVIWLRRKTRNFLYNVLCTARLLNTWQLKSVSALMSMQFPMPPVVEISPS